MENDVDAPDNISFDGNADTEREGDDEAEEDEVEKYVEEEDEQEEQDIDVDDGKEPRMFAQGDMVNTSADDVDTMADNYPVVLPEEGQEMHEQAPQTQPPPPAPWP